jgi:hydrogenase maturation protease
MVEVPEAVLVIAWGNPLREDDGVAWHVLDVLRTLRPRPGLPRLRLRHAHELTPELAEPISRAAGVVFVDARRDGRPGEVRCEEVRPGPGADPLAHALSPEGLLLYAERLCGRAPRAAIVSLPGLHFAFGEELSPEVRRAVPKAAGRIVRLARGWLTTAHEPARPQPVA